MLGGDSAMLTQLRAGAINFLTYLDGSLATIVPLSSISNVGFAFKDYAEVFSAMDGPLGAMVRGEIVKAGLHVFERIWDNGFRQLTTSTKAIVVPDDLNGLKIRVPVSPIEVRSSKRWARRRRPSRSPKSTPRCKRTWSTERRTR